MEYSKLPVAKRTRSSCNRYLEERYKRAKSSGAGVPVPEADVVSPVEYVVLDEEDTDEGLSDEEGSSDVVVESVFDKGKGKKNERIVDDDEGLSDEEDSSDVVVVSVFDKGKGKKNERIIDDDDSLSDEESESDVIVMSVVDKGKRKIDEINVNYNDDDDDMAEDLELSDSLSNEGCSEESDESYRGNASFRSNHAESSDQSSSYAKSEDEGNDDSRKDVLQIPSSSETDDESGREYVNKNGGRRRKNLKMATRRKADKDFSAADVLADSLAGNEEALKKIENEKINYKFWFTDEDKKPVEKSEFDKELDELFEELNKCLTCEEIGSTPVEVDNGDHSKMQTDCIQGNHHLVLDEQIGILCKYCSYVHREIRHILPDFSKSSSHRRRRGFVQPECPILDHFQDTGSEEHDYEDYNTLRTVWDLVPGARSSMYEHQREGFEFIWKNLAGGIVIEELEKPLPSSGSGCIISHAPGTGKTRLTIVFLQSFMKLYPDSRPVIIAPKSMLLTWEEEFKKWNVDIPFHNMNNLEFSGQENEAAVSVSRKGRGSSNSATLTRLVKLFSWKMDKSILGITYALFDKLVAGATRNADCTPSVEQMGNALLKLPTLIVLDEGHTPRNDQSYIYNSLLDVETERRIILSGTPFQNNFDELYNTLRLVNPKFDRKSSKFDGGMKKNLRKISKELKSKWSGHKLRELKDMISPFVHVHKGNILQKSCPGLKNAFIHLQPTDLQQNLFADLRISELINGYLDLSHVISLVSVHPSLLPERLFQDQQLSTYRDRLERLKSNPFSGAKTKFVVELCRLSEALKEKVLIYSQYIDPLIFIKEQLQTYFKWTEGREVLYMDGSLEAKQRQSSISSLNDPKSKVRVLLASIKACSEGIHLVGASRVVFLDVVWNPSVERQAISRAYRLGQKKIVYTYHLIAEEMDNQKFAVQAAKDRLSEMVFSFKDMDSLKENMPEMVSEDEILQEMYQRNDKLGGLFTQILYQPKESNLADTFDTVESS